MIQINLTDNEVVVLKDLVETCLQDLRVEIQATDNMGYKAMLKERKEILMKLLAAITEGQAEAA